MRQLQQLTASDCEKLMILLLLTVQFAFHLVTGCYEKLEAFVRMLCGVQLVPVSTRFHVSKTKLHKPCIVHAGWCI